MQTEAVEETQPADAPAHVDDEKPPEAEAQAEPEGDDEKPDEGEKQTTVVSLGEESPPQEKQPTPSWVKELRKRTRELERENRELKARQAAPVTTTAPTLGPKPTLRDHDFDEAKFEAALERWTQDRAKVESHKAEQAKAVANAQEKRQQRLMAYAQGAKSLEVDDFEDAEAEVLGSFDVTQQEIILQGASNASAVVYALGKSPSQAKQLASIKDPIEFAVALGRLESKVTIKKSPSDKTPPPEERIRASGGAAPTDKTLERLEKEAERNGGDRTKIIAYKRSKKG